MNSETTIKLIQFKRGEKANLIEYLINTDKLKLGEPAFETDTGKLKIGDGVSDYGALPYIGDNNTDNRFIIQDPVQNQVLLYDSASQKWINKDLSDEKSIVYLSTLGLTLKGYTQAKQGQMLVKDIADGIAWIDPINTDDLQRYVDQAATHATNAGNSAVQAGNSATSATKSAAQAEILNQQTVALLNSKFWWGTIEEYNALTSINPDTFYFINTGV